SRGLSLGVGPTAEGVAVRMVTASFFSLLGARPDLGRFFSTDEDSLGHAAHVAVLSREFWTRRYGADRGVLGQRLRLGRSVYTIIGVAPRGFSGDRKSTRLNSRHQITSYAAFSVKTKYHAAGAF